MTEVYVCQTPHSSATGEAHGLFWSEKREKEKKREREGEKAFQHNIQLNSTEFLAAQI